MKKPNEQKLNTLKLSLISLVLLYSSSCSTFIKFTELVHPEWVTNSVPVEAVTNAPPIPPVESSDPRVEKVWKSGSELGIKVTGIDNWPTTTAEGKTLIGIVCCNGKKFDWLSTANVKNQKKVVNNLYEGKYFQDIKTGQTVMISIKDIHGKNETERIPFVWPWVSTRKNDLSLPR